jgi:hypothetical protein
MAKVKKNSEFLDRLRASLIRGLNAGGIPATVQFARIPTTHLYRVGVLAPKFKLLKHSERQDLVWRIVEQALSPDEMLQISMILTLTPSETRGAAPREEAIKS